MPFLGLFALLMANASGFEQSIQRSMGSEASLLYLSSVDQEVKVVPFVIEGSVESFDSVERAKALANLLSQRCRIFLKLSLCQHC